MFLKGMCTIAGCVLSLNSMGGTMGPIQSGPYLPWIAIGSLGYTNYQKVFDCDKDTAFARFAIGKDLISTRFSSFGLEVGSQSGNTMRLQVSENMLDKLGGLPIQSTMKPMLDDRQLSQCLIVA